MDFDETMTEADFRRAQPDSLVDSYFVSAGLDAPQHSTRGANEEGGSAPFALEMDAWEPSLLRKLLGQ